MNVYPDVVQAAVNLQSEINAILDGKTDPVIDCEKLTAQAWRDLLVERAQQQARQHNVSVQDVLSVRAHLLVCRRFARRSETHHAH